MPLEPSGHPVTTARHRERAPTLPLAFPPLERWPASLAPAIRRPRAAPEAGRTDAVPLRRRGGSTARSGTVSRVARRPEGAARYSPIRVTASATSNGETGR